MMRPSPLALAFFWAGLWNAHAADATSPVDYTQRNAEYSTGGQVKPDTRKPEIATGVQHQRVTPPRVDKQPAAVGDRRAAVEMTETREKVVREKDVHPTEKIDVQKSRFDQQRSKFSTATETKKPPTVAKYQDSLTAASASNMARFPAMSGATTAKINRFVFRKNGGEPADTVPGAKIVPAAGGGQRP